MVFPDNILELVYEETGFTLSFNALDAMKLINTTTSSIHVAYSEEWRALKSVPTFKLASYEYYIILP